MNIAELFVNLGVKGADQAGKALGGVKSGLGDVKGMSLEAKAAILGVIYGLEQMMSQSAKMGTSLTNFNALTGMSAQQLQQWQYAARQAGVAGDEMAGSMKAVQSTMANMLLGKGAPEGIAMLANKVGFDPARARDTAYVLGQLQKFAQTVPADIGNQMIKSFGVSDGVIAAMRRNAFRPDVFAKAPTYSNNEVGQLDKVNVAWSNLGNKIEMAFGHLTSKHGMDIVKDLSKMTDGVIKLADALAVLAEKSKVFLAIGWAAEKIATTMNLLGVGIDDATGSHKKEDNAKLFGKDSKLTGAMNWRDDVDKTVIDFFKKNHETIAAGMMAGAGGGIPMIPPSTQTPAKQQTINNNANINNNFQHDGKDHKKTGHSVQKSVNDAFRQIQAQGQGS